MAWGYQSFFCLFLSFCLLLICILFFSFFCVLICDIVIFVVFFLFYFLYLFVLPFFCVSCFFSFVFILYSHICDDDDYLCKADAKSDQRIKYFIASCVTLYNFVFNIMILFMFVSFFVCLWYILSPYDITSIFFIVGVFISFSLRFVFYVIINSKSQSHLQIDS